MIIFHNYNYVSTQLIDAGLASLSFYAIHFYGYYTEEEKMQKLAAAKKCTPLEWSALCNEETRKITEQMKRIILLLDGYDIHQFTKETSTIVHYQSDWDFFFSSNKGWNGRNFFDRFSLNANNKRTAAANMELLERFLSMLENADIDAPNIKCEIQYTAVPDKAAIEKAALSIIEQIAEKTIKYNGAEGKIKKYCNGSGFDSFAFFKKGARKKCYSIDPINIVLSFPSLLKAGRDSENMEDKRK